MSEPIDEEMAWEDTQGFPRATRQPYFCQKCGKKFMTREVYLAHKERCRGKVKVETEQEKARKVKLEGALKEFKLKHALR